jgi:hypothetical protein
MTIRELVKSVVTTWACCMVAYGGIYYIIMGVLTCIKT